ncbi:MAG TPA: hypothetical protein V6C63_11195 [Allocoleopsis sp.]
MPNIDFGTPAALGFPALYANRNCTLTFPIISDATAIDPETGNIQPSTTTVTLEAIAPQVSQIPKTQEPQAAKSPWAIGAKNP